MPLNLLFTNVFLLILAYGILSLFVYLFRYVQNSLAGKKLGTQVSHVIVD